MWSDRIIVSSPAFNQHLRLLQRVEDFSGQKLITELSIKRLVVSILPGTARLDEQGFDANPAEPGSDGFGRELRAVIGADVIRRPFIREQVGQEMKNIV